MTIQIKNPGFVTTVQDLGRYGYSHLGISPAGAADSLSLRIANLLVGNSDNAAALEMTLVGASAQFDEPAIVAVTGADCAIELDGTRVPHSQALRVGPGSELKLGPLTNGARAYLAIQGGIAVPLVMGSASTHLGARFGGLEGRPLRTGDRLGIGDASGLRPRRLGPGSEVFTGISGDTKLRVTHGAQQDWFDPDALAALFAQPLAVTDQSGRTGLRLRGLRGERIMPRDASQLLTDGVPLGALQIPPDGEPIILFVDQQTTGGYPKIANVIAADMHRVGQLRAQDTLRFAEVSIEEAVRLLREQESWLREIFESDL